MDGRDLERARRARAAGRRSGRSTRRPGRDLIAALDQALEDVVRYMITGAELR